MIVTGLEPATSRPVILRSTIDLHDPPEAYSLCSLKNQIPQSLNLPQSKLNSNYCICQNGTKLSRQFKFKFIKRHFSAPNWQFDQFAQMSSPESSSQYTSQESAQFALESKPYDKDMEQALMELLPQIEQQLLKEINHELEEEFHEKLELQKERIRVQARQEYELALKELQQTKSSLEKEKVASIEMQLEELCQQYESLNNGSIVAIQEKFLEENFESTVMKHPDILNLEKEMEEQYFITLQENHNDTKERKLKEIILYTENQQIKVRKDLDKKIKQTIYESSGLEGMKTQIQDVNANLGSLKSQYNLKIRKIDQKIQEYQQKCKEISRMGDIEELQCRRDELKFKVDQQNQNQRGIEGENESDDSLENFREREEYIQQQEEGADEDEDSLNSASQQQEEGESPENQHHLEANQIHNNNVYIQNSFGNPNLSANIRIEDKQNMLVSQQFAECLGKYITSEQLRRSVEQQESIRVQQHASSNEGSMLLNLSNVSLLLKNKLEECLSASVQSRDPLQPYIYHSRETHFAHSVKDTENDPRSDNRKHQATRSNFNEIYEKHLKKLNSQRPQHKKGKETRGLSAITKKTVVANLANYYKSHFQSKDFNHQKSGVQESSVEDAQERMKMMGSYQPNLLGSYQTHLA